MIDRVLITGATGFLGSWALRYWKATHPDIELWATSNQPSTPQLQTDKFLQVDLCDSKAIQDLVFACQPTHVIHLAGPTGNAKLADYLRVNVIGTENLYNALARIEGANRVRVIQASSAASYGMVYPKELPITEKQPPRPVSSYGLSKLTQDYLAWAMWRTFGLKIICARVFNILGPAQPDNLVPMTFIRQLINVRAGLADRLEVGNTLSRRDFVDVRDIVSAFDALINRGRPGEVYNIASGRDISIQEIIEKLMVISKQHILVETVSERTRSTDVPCVRADISKITKETGWQPKISLLQSLEAMWHQAANISEGLGMQYENPRHQIPRVQDKAQSEKV